MRRSFRRVRTTFLVLIVTFLILPANSFAQKKPRQPDSTIVATIFDTLAVKLALSDSQKVKIMDIVSHSSNELRDAFEKYGNDREILALMRNNITDRRDREIEGILNKKQRKDYELVKVEIADMVKKLRRKAKKAKKETNK